VFGLFFRGTLGNNTITMGGRKKVSKLAVGWGAFENLT
jgi:hypothetical protein